MTMFAWLSWFTLFAQEAAPKDAPPQAPPGAGLLMMLPAFLAIILLYQFMFNNPNKREQKRIAQLKSVLKKNDPVVTAGGIYGTVANLNLDKDEVTVKVDENTRLRMQIRSVYPIGPMDAKADKDAEKKSDTEAK